MKYDRDCSERMQAKTLRILRLIDLLAGYRLPKSLQQINREVCEATGLRCTARTTYRDLLILKAIGLIDETPNGFKLDLKRSERLQCAACSLFKADGTLTYTAAG